jgi:hypothetical protein
LFLFSALFCPVVWTLSDVPVEKGWNLVSFPMDSEQELESYLSERLFNSEEFPLLLEDSVEKIWSYDNGWFCYEPGVSEQCVLNS